MNGAIKPKPENIVDLTPDKTPAKILVENMLFNTGVYPLTFYEMGS